MPFDQDRLEELLNRWEELREQGQQASEAELCRDCPELLPEFRKRTAKLINIGKFLKGEIPGDKDELTAAGRYRPIELHAHGGLGEVFLARDEELGREVALKRIRSGEVADHKRAKHFQFEAEITGRLDHPGVVPVYGLGRDASGRLYYAMRFIRGETLQQALERFHRTYPPGKNAGARGIVFQKLIRSFLTVCQTIGYAHSQNVIHRDIKPANIMLGHYGETLVVDWGLAKRLPRFGGDADTVVLSGDSETPNDLTRLGDIKGSPAYMSPEQAEGRTDLVGQRSDIYCLGATLYTVLTGRPPFTNEDVYKLLDQVKLGNLVPPRQMRKDIPRPLEAICLKAMSLKATDRYGTALELAADLEHWLADDAVSAWREPLLARAQRLARKHQTLASTLTAAVLVALLGISVLAIQQGVKNEELKKANAEKTEALEARTKARKDESDAVTEQERIAKKLAIANEKAEAANIKALKSVDAARHESYKSLVLAANRALSAGDRAFAGRALDEAPEEQRNIEWRLLYRCCQQSRNTSRAPGGLIYSIARSPDGSRLAVADLNGPLKIYNVADGSLAATLDVVARKVAFLPDSNFLIVQSLSVANRPWSDYCELPSPVTTGPLELWSVEKGRGHIQYRMFVDDFALSGNGRLLAAVIVTWPDDGEKMTSRVELFDVFGQKLLGTSEEVPGQISGIAFSPDSLRIYAVARQESPRPASAKPAKPSGFNTRYAPTWRADFASVGFLFIAWNLAGPGGILAPEIAKTGPENADAAGMAVTPDGKQILVSDRNLFNAMRGRLAGTLFSKGHIIVINPETGETVNADAYALDAVDSAIDSMRRRPRNLFSMFGGAAGAIAVSPDGKRLAAVIGSRIVVFDTKSAARIAEFSGHLSTPRAVVFDRNSNRLYSAGDDGLAKLWDIERPRAERIVVLRGIKRVGDGLAVSGDSRRMAVSAGDGQIEIRDVPSCRVLQKLPSPWTAAPEKMAAADKLAALPGGRERLFGNTTLASQLCFSPDGKRLTAIYENRLVCVWDVSGDQPVVVEFNDEFALNEDPQHAFLARIVLSPNGRYVAAEWNSEQDRSFRVWDMETRNLVVKQGKDSFLGSNPEMRFDDSSRRFLLKRTSTRAKPPILAWELPKGESSESNDLQDCFASGQGIAPNGARQVIVDDGRVQIVDRPSGGALIEYGNLDEFTSAILSPDGNYILAGGLSHVDLLDVSP